MCARDLAPSNSAHTLSCLFSACVSSLSLFHSVEFEKDPAELGRVMGLLGPLSSALQNRRRFLKQILAGTALVIAGAAAAFAAKVGAQWSWATEDFAKFTIAERDQIHTLFNNTRATPNDLHSAMIAGLSLASIFEACIGWAWPNPQHYERYHVRVGSQELIWQLRLR
jgi:hypothetical protein